MPVRVVPDPDGIYLDVTEADVRLMTETQYKVWQLEQKLESSEKTSRASHQEAAKLQSLLTHIGLTFWEMKDAEERLRGLLSQYGNGAG